MLLLPCRILLIFQGQKFTSKAFKVEAGAVTKNAPTIISTGEEKVNPGNAKKKKRATPLTKTKSKTSPKNSARMGRIARLNRKKLERSASQRAAATKKLEGETAIQEKEKTDA